MVGCGYGGGFIVCSLVLYFVLHYNFSHQVSKLSMSLYKGAEPLFMLEKHFALHKEFHPLMKGDIGKGRERKEADETREGHRIFELKDILG